MNVADDVRKHMRNNADPSVAAGFASSTHSADAEAAPAESAHSTHTAQDRQTTRDANAKSKSKARQSTRQSAKQSAKQSIKPEKYARGTRSYTMSHIRGKDTSIEVEVRSYLFRRGLRFRKNDKRYPGHPDVVLPKYHTIVFINGCFWHAHEGCPKYSMPKSNVEFWTAKLTRNRERDARQHAELEAAGWRVIVVWECELGKAAREERLARLYAQIVGDAA